MRSKSPGQTTSYREALRSLCLSGNLPCLLGPASPMRAQVLRAPEPPPRSQHKCLLGPQLITWLSVHITCTGTTAKRDKRHTEAHVATSCRGPEGQAVKSAAHSTNSVNPGDGIWWARSPEAPWRHRGPPCQRPCKGTPAPRVTGATAQRAHHLPRRNGSFPKGPHEGRLCSPARLPTQPSLYKLY